MKDRVLLYAKTSYSPREIAEMIKLDRKSREMDGRKFIDSYMTIPENVRNSLEISERDSLASK